MEPDYLARVPHALSRVRAFDPADFHLRQSIEGRSGPSDRRGGGQRLAITERIGNQPEGEQQTQAGDDEQAPDDAALAVIAVFVAPLALVARWLL